MCVCCVSRRRQIYLLPLGDVSGTPPTPILCDLLQRWFCLEVVAMKPLASKVLASLERDEGGSGYGPQACALES